MRVNDKKPLGPVERAASGGSSSEPAAATAKADRVSVEETRAAVTAVDGARKHAASNRAARLRELEAAVRSGAFKPDAGRIAEEILSAAEVDAKLRALLRAG